MGEIFVIGHKNPDTDSICSAYAYANLKNKIDNKNRYIAARCGSLNDQTKFVFSNISDEPPVFIRDIYPKVKDVMTKEVIYSTPDEPIYNAVKNLESLGVRLTPVVDGQTYKGVVSILEISRFFLPNNIENKPEYLVRPENFKDVIPGDFIKIGDRKEFLTNFLVGGMPFETFLKRFKNLHADKTVLIVGKRRDFIEYAIKNNMAGIIVTGIANTEEFDFEITGYKGFVYLSCLDTAETLRRIVFSVPIKSIMTDKIPITEPNFYLEDARKIMINENHRGLPVVENGKLVGIITRSDLLKDKKHRIILMDHNELSQSVDGAEIAEIVEIVDHHRLGTIKTKSPVTFFAKPVGSTCTLVFQQYKLNNVEIDDNSALALLSGILSDTVVLKSPTMTNEDIETVEFLAAKLGIDYKEYGKKMFEASSKLKGRSPESIVATDFKIFEEQGYRIGIGQVETVNLMELNDIKQILLDEVKKVASVKNLNWASLLVTDIIEERSVLLTSGFQALENLLIYSKLEENIYDLPGVLSRKKQLLPEVLRVLELLNN
ncbi:putative manganese-dependent inorganic diphosphatase [Deferribacteraceae bacterium V6Fe1]|nr:putative manganese-dependent inorganic diphosphatase [Deferribacteraceae bacterium V6Fe1]